MFRSWPWWISLVLIAVSVGWFWMVSLDLRFERVESGGRPVAAPGPVEVKK